jgi:hypothetical protein
VTGRSDRCAHHVSPWQWNADAYDNGEKRASRSGGCHLASVYTHRTWRPSGQSSPVCWNAPLPGNSIAACRSPGPRTVGFIRGGRRDDLCVQYNTPAWPRRIASRSSRRSRCSSTSSRRRRRERRVLLCVFGREHPAPLANRGLEDHPTAAVGARRDGAAAATDVGVSLREQRRVWATRSVSERLTIER